MVGRLDGCTAGRRGRLDAKRSNNVAAAGEGVCSVCRWLEDLGGRFGPVSKVSSFASLSNLL